MILRSTVDSRNWGQEVYGTGGSRLGRVQGFTEHGFEPEREDMGTFLFEHDPGAQGIRGRTHDVALLELREDGEVAKHA